ncbi:MAG: N-acetyltransferase, partial [Syntrophobacteraceae bacterium]
MSIRNFRDETLEVSGLDFLPEKICRRKRMRCAARKCGKDFFDDEYPVGLNRTIQVIWSADGQERTIRKIWGPEEKRADQVHSSFPLRAGQDPIYIGSSGPGDPPRKTAEEVKHFMEESATCHQEKKKVNVTVRRMEIDDIATVFHLGEKLFTASEVPNLFRTWDEYEVINYFQNDSEFCLVAQTCDEVETIIGFLLGTTVTKSRSAWKYGYLVWLGVDPVFHEMGVGAKLFKRFRDLMVADGARMLLVDSEADNEVALHFFSKMGFGHPQEHIYLALNLDS